MPHIIKTTAYKFEELSDSAKQHAIEKNYDFNVDHDWWDGIYDDAATIGLKLTGFDLDRGRSIDGELTQSAKACADAIIANHGAGCDTYKLAESYLKEYTVLSVTFLLQGKTEPDFIDDEDVAEMDDEFKKSLLNAYWKILQDEYEYLTSDECIKESLISNEYDFDEDGTMI